MQGEYRDAVLRMALGAALGGDTAHRPPPPPSAEEAHIAVKEEVMSELSEEPELGEAMSEVSAEEEVPPPVEEPQPELEPGPTRTPCKYGPAWERRRRMEATLVKDPNRLTKTQLRNRRKYQSMMRTLCELTDTHVP